MSISFCSLGKFSSIISSSKLSALFSLFSLSEGTLIMQMLSSDLLNYPHILTLSAQIDNFHYFVFQITYRAQQCPQRALWSPELGALEVCSVGAACTSGVEGLTGVEELTAVGILVGGLAPAQLAVRHALWGGSGLLEDGIYFPCN